MVYVDQVRYTSLYTMLDFAMDNVRALTKATAGWMGQ